MIVDLRIKADKNCEECEKHLLSVDDINIVMFFEDWRECNEHCSECGEEDRFYKVSYVIHRQVRESVAHDHAVFYLESAAEQDRENDAERHYAEPAELYQDEHNGLSEA